MNPAISILWGIFALLFLILGLHYRAEARRQIPPFEVPDRFAAHPGISVSVGGTGLDQPLQEFVLRFNRYIDEQNAVAQRLNTRSACGYFLAAGTAVLSALISIG